MRKRADTNMKKPTTETAVIAPVSGKEHRTSRRVKIPRPLLARPSDPKYKEEIQTTLNTSLDGLYFRTRLKHYHVGMRVSVILGYVPNDRCNSTSLGKVVRIDQLDDGSFGIAVQIQLR
jgi:PilZ domain